MHIMVTTIFLVCSELDGFILASPLVSAHKTIGQQVHAATNNTYTIVNWRHINVYKHILGIYFYLFIFFFTLPSEKWCFDKIKYYL